MPKLTVAPSHLFLRGVEGRKEVRREGEKEGIQKVRVILVLVIKSHVRINTSFGLVPAPCSMKKTHRERNSLKMCTKVSEVNHVV